MLQSLNIIQHYSDIINSIMCRNINSGDGESIYSNFKEASQYGNIYIYTVDKDALHLLLLKFTADFSITKAGYKKKQLRSL